MNDFRQFPFDYSFHDPESAHVEAIRDHLGTRPVWGAGLFGSYVGGMANRKIDIEILVGLVCRQKKWGYNVFK